MRTSFKILIGIVAFLILIRIALPYIILHFGNNVLSSMDGYYGHIRDIDIRLYRGAYVIDSIYINKIDSVNDHQTPFMSARKVDLSIEWKSLFDGRLTGELEFQDPFLKFARNKTELMQVQKDTADFRHVLNKFMPLQINRFDVNNGTIIYIDSTTTPLVNVQMDNVYITALNLKSVKDTALLPAKVDASAHIYQGQLLMNMKLDPLADKPLFDMNIKMENTNLPELNDFFKAYSNIDISKGTFGLYAEIASKEGQFKGYVKPIIKDLDVKGPEDRADNFMNKTLESIAEVFGKILENPKADQVATKIPFEGDYDKTNTSLLTSIVELFRNAFVTALYPAIDYQINIASVDEKDKKKQNIIKRIFGNKEDPDKEKK